MGTFGPGPFENDDAADLVADLADGVDIDFGQLFELTDELLETREASNIVAAAELIASAKTGKYDSVPEELEAFVKRSKPQLQALAPIALAALKRVREDSELRDLWQESAELADWEATLASIEKRLS